MCGVPTNLVSHGAEALRGLFWAVQAGVGDLNIPPLRSKVVNENVIIALDSAQTTTDFRNFDYQIPNTILKYSDALVTSSITCCAGGGSWPLLPD